MPAPRKANPGPVSLRAEAGRDTFTLLFRRWQRQAKQPTWITLAAAANDGEKLLHSSQLQGWRDGTLFYPAPMCFVALGNLNLALAAGSLPESLRRKWEGIEPMRLPDGTVCDATTLFALFAGLIEVDVAPVMELVPATEAATLRLFGKWLRRQFGTMGIDFACDDRSVLIGRAPCLARLLFGGSCGWADVEGQLVTIAGMVNATVDDLWVVLQELQAQAAQAA